MTALLLPCAVDRGAIEGRRASVSERRVPAPPGAITLKLATWNIAWLDSEPGDGENAREERDYALLRSYAQRLDADIVAFQEVENELAARRVFEPELYAIVMEERDDPLRVGFAYKRDLAARGVSIQRNPDYVALDLGGLRRGIDVTLEAQGWSLRLLNVHLKAGCWSDAAKDQAACVKLRTQLARLEDWIDARASEGVAFVVLGDFNRRLPARDRFWRELDDSEPPNADLSAPGQRLKPACWGGAFPGFVDHFVLDRLATAYLIESSFEELVYEERGAAARQRLSDHCPLALRLALPEEAQEP